MGSRTARTLVATAPDGTEVTQQTSGSYDTAGLLQAADGRWFIAAHGWSRDSVYSRVHARYNRGDYRAMHVTDLIEQTAPVVRLYFGTHSVSVNSVYSPGTHEGLSENDLRAVLLAAGASLSELDGVARVAMGRPGEKGHASVQVSDGIASVSYADGHFSVEMPAGWRRIQWHGAGRSALRQLLRLGWTGVAFAYLGRVADFEASELVKSMNARKA